MSTTRYGEHFFCVFYGYILWWTFTFAFFADISCGGHILCVFSGHTCILWAILFFCIFRGHLGQTFLFAFFVDMNFLVADIFWGDIDCGGHSFLRFFVDIVPCFGHFCAWRTQLAPAGSGHRERTATESAPRVTASNCISGSFQAIPG